MKIHQIPSYCEMTKTGGNITPSGRTRLPFPILQSDLDNLNILKIRPATDSEVEDFIEKNNL